MGILIIIFVCVFFFVFNVFFFQAKSEIYILQKLAENYEREKIDLQNLIKEKKEQLNGRSKKSIKINKPIVTETIEIEDSDEEVSTTMIFRKITTSGKVCFFFLNLF